MTKTPARAYDLRQVESLKRRVRGLMARHARDQAEEFARLARKASLARASRLTDLVIAQSRRTQRAMARLRASR
ncbi:hypothetical protein LCGC14_3143130, partial [marine sediment metagenome]